MPVKTLVTVAISVMTARVAMAETSSAEVDPPDSAYIERADALSVGVGFNSPTGGIGMEYEHAMALWSTVSVGAGMSSGGPVASTKLRLRTMVGRSAYGIGAVAAFGGGAVGHFNILGPGEHEEIELGLWFGGEAYYEYRTGNNFVLRFEIGGTKLARMSSCTHVEHEGETLFGGHQEESSAPCTMGQTPNAAVFGTFSLGKAF